MRPSPSPSPPPTHWKPGQKPLPAVSKPEPLPELPVPLIRYVNHRHLTRWNFLWTTTYLYSQSIAVMSNCTSYLPPANEVAKVMCLQVCLSTGGVRGTWRGGACVAGGHACSGGHACHSRYYGIQSVSGWYASYWNAFLVPFSLQPNFFEK